MFSLNSIHKVMTIPPFLTNSHQTKVTALKWHSNIDDQRINTATNSSMAVSRWSTSADSATKAKIPLNGVI